jgi:hypothetical protein
VPDVQCRQVDPWFRACNTESATNNVTLVVKALHCAIYGSTALNQCDPNTKCGPKFHPSDHTQRTETIGQAKTHVDITKITSPRSHNNTPEFFCSGKWCVSVCSVSTSHLCYALLSSLAEACRHRRRGAVLRCAAIPVTIEKPSNVCMKAVLLTDN